MRGALAICWVLGLTPALGRTLEQTPSAGWTVSAVSDEGGKAFERCDAQSEQQPDGAGLLLSLDRSSKWSIGFFGQLGVQPGQSNLTRYRIDRGQVFSGTARAVSEQLVKLPLPDPSEPLRALRSGRELTVDGGNDRLQFALRGVPAALTEIRNCVERWKNRGVSTVSRASAEPGVNVRPLSEPEKRLEAMTVAANLLSRAQIAGFELQPPDAPSRLLGHDVVWRAQNLYGSLRLVGLDGRTVEKVPADLISADIGDCSDKFAADATPNAAGKSVSLFTSCQGEKGRSFGYLVVPRPLGGAYVVSLLGTTDKAEPLRSAASALRDVTAQVLERLPQLPVSGAVNTPLSPEEPSSGRPSGPVTVRR
jgi:hypothetical protein